MMKLPDDYLKTLPPDYRPSDREIEQAYGLFGERNGVRPDLRILVGSYDRSAGLDKSGVPDRKHPTLRIIIDNRLCFFFYGKSGEWLFDGYECGNYENYWTEFDWKPEITKRQTGFTMNWKKAIKLYKKIMGMMENESQ